MWGGRGWGALAEKERGHPRGLTPRTTPPRTMHAAQDHATPRASVAVGLLKGRLWLLYRVCTGTELKTRIHMQERTCLIFLQISTSSKFDLLIVSWTYICSNQTPMRRVVMGSYW